MSRKSIDGLINASKQASLSLPESSAMKTIQKAMQAIQSNHLASLSLPESPAMGTVRKAMQAMQASHLASLTLPKSSAMKTIQKATQASLKVSLEFPEPAVIKLAQEAMQGRHMASLAFQETSAMKSIRKMTQYNQFASLAFQESAAMKSVREMIDSQSLADLAGLSSLKAASLLENSPFSNSTLSAYETGTSSVENVNEAILELDSELSAEVSSETDFNQLSEKSKCILLYIYHTYILPMFYIALAMVMSTVYGDELRMALGSVTTSSEVHSFTHNAKMKFDRMALAGFRVTTANSLKLRKSPNMSAETIDLLPLGTLIEVIDRSNRSWLFVEVEMDGEFIQGWVSRKYTAYFK